MDAEHMDKETKILVADENNEFRTRCREVLASAGASVTEARSGEEAMSLTSRQNYDIVIADLWSADAVTLLRRANDRRNADAGRAVPAFIVLT